MGLVGQPPGPSGWGGGGDRWVPQHTHTPMTDHHLEHTQVGVKKMFRKKFAHQLRLPSAKVRPGGQVGGSFAFFPRFWIPNKILSILRPMRASPGLTTHGHRILCPELEHGEGVGEKEVGAYVDGGGVWFGRTVWGGGAVCWGRVCHEGGLSAPVGACGGSPLEEGLLPTWRGGLCVHPFGGGAGSKTMGEEGSRGTPTAWVQYCDEVRVGRPSLCTPVLLLPLGVPWQ